MKMLIVGGAGYIGSHIVLEALNYGYSVKVFDNLSTGKMANVDKNAEFFQGTTMSNGDLSRAFKEDKFDCVIHLAANKAAGESMTNPSKYATNNIIGSLNLINNCVKYGVETFIFSSSAAVYGIPNYTPIDELHPLKPTNYYGHTKLMVENSLSWFSRLKGMNFASLRYFNAAGFDIKNRIVGIENSPQNLIPIVMEAAIGERKKIDIYGNDYATKDGTGIRDYIHVNDLSSAHIKAINYVKSEKKNLTINLGTGSGFSVLDVINKVENISKVELRYDFKERRDGDSDIVTADAKLAKKLISWEPIYSDLDTIISTTWKVYSLLK